MHYILFYGACENFLSKREKYRKVHLDLARARRVEI